MAIAPGDIQFYLSAPLATSGYSQGSTPGNSLGNFISTTQLNPGTPLDNLFTDITPSENVGLQTDYQCVFILNNTQTALSAQAPFAWLPSQLYQLGGAQIWVGADTTFHTVFNYSAGPQAGVIANSLTAPSTVLTWYSPSSLFGLGAPLPTLAPGYCCAIWLRRQATNSAPMQQTFNLEVTFTSSN